MAIPWMTVLKLVPWNDVIRNAPQIADAARKLWDNSRTGATPAGAARQERAPTGLPADGGHAATVAAENAALRIRLEQGELQLRELQQRVLASSALINQLAEQNTSLIARVELNRRRSLLLSVATVVSMLIAVTALAVVLRA
jgi:hypothetical protein